MQSNNIPIDNRPKITLGLSLIALSLFVGLTSYTSPLMNACIFILTAIVIHNGYTSKSFNLTEFKLFICFFLIQMIYSLFGYGEISSENYRGPIYQMISICCFISISQKIKYLSFKEINFLINIIFIAIGLSLTATFYVSTIDPTALRQYGGGSFEESEASAATYYYRIGMMRYSLAHGMVGVGTGLAALVCFAERKWIRILSLILIIVLVRIYFDMVITTAFLSIMLTLSILIAYKYSKGSIPKAILLFAVAAFILVSSGVILNSVNLIQNSGNTTFSQKITDLIESIETGSKVGQMVDREYLHDISINSFRKNPVLGLAVDNGSRTEIGNHSFFYDNLAIYGIMFAVFLLAWWFSIKRLKNYVNKNYWYTYLLCLLPFCIMVINKSGDSIGSFLFVSIVFLQLVFVYLQKEKKDGYSINQL